MLESPLKLGALSHTIFLMASTKFERDSFMIDKRWDCLFTMTGPSTGPYWPYCHVKMNRSGHYLKREHVS